MIVFHSLTQEDLAAIVDIQVGHLASGWPSRKIALELTDRGQEAAGRAGLRPAASAPGR